MMRAATEDAYELLRGLYYDTALSANPTVLGALQRLVPASRILLGTDYPFAQEVGVRYSLDGLAAYEGSVNFRKAKFREDSHFGAPAAAVVATDSVSVNADCDNGTRFMVCLGSEGAMTLRVSA
jgi:hypothetical protein